MDHSPLTASKQAPPIPTERETPDGMLGEESQVDKPSRQAPPLPHPPWFQRTGAHTAHSARPTADTSGRCSQWPGSCSWGGTGPPEGAGKGGEGVFRDHKESQQWILRQLLSCGRQRLLLGTRSHRTRDGLSCPLRQLQSRPRQGCSKPQRGGWGGGEEGALADHKAYSATPIP